jgi:hypothetical protein
MSLLKTKTFWLGVANIVAGVIVMASVNEGSDAAVGLGLIDFGLALIFGRHAIAKLQRKRVGRLKGT